MASNSDTDLMIGTESYAIIEGVNFEGALHRITTNLKKDCIVNPGVGFLCQSVCPQSCIYPNDIQTPPTLLQCYDGLRGHRETQPIAVSILLHILTLVGAQSEDIEELKETANQEDIEKGGADKEKFHDELNPQSIAKFMLRKLMFDIYKELSQDERTAMINFTCRKLKPPRTYGYTKCLLQNFIIMMQNDLIETDKVEQLYICLNVLGRLDLVKMVDTYCQERAIPRPRVRICTKRIDSLLMPVQATSEDYPKLDVSEPTGGRNVKAIVADAEPASVSSVVAEPDIFAKGSEESGRCQGALMIPPEKRPLLHLNPDIQGAGARGQDMITDAEKDAALHSERPVSKIKLKDGTPELVEEMPRNMTTIHLESNRLSHEVAYVKWDPVSLDHEDPEPPKYVVEFTTRGEREGCRGEVNALRVTTENKEFAALKLEGDKEYSITVSVESPTGTILARGVQSISLPREEPVPAPQDVKVSPLNSTSLRVQWKKPQTPTNAIGYIVFYSPSSDSPSAGEQKVVYGVNTTHTTLKELQPGLEYTVQVVLKMPDGVVGPPSKSERGKPQRMRGRHAASIGLCASIPCIALALLMLVVSSGVLAGYSVPRNEDRNYNITEGDTIDLGNYNRFMYDVMSVSTEFISSVTVYLHETLCTDLQVHRNASYGYENTMVPIAETAGVNPANGYFAHRSEPTFQLNATGPMMLTNCSAAFYIFDNPYYYDQFRLYGRTANKIYDICFDVFDSASKLSNKPMTYHIERSTYLYIGIFLTGVTNASLRIAGTQNVYNHTDFTNYSTCVIDGNTPDCSFPLGPILRVNPSKPTSPELCALAYWKPFTGARNRQNINTTATYDIKTSFPHNFVQVISLSFICVSTLISVAGFVLLFVSAVNLCRY